MQSQEDHKQKAGANSALLHFCVRCASLRAVSMTTGALLSQAGNPARFDVLLSCLFSHVYTPFAWRFVGLPGCLLQFSGFDVPPDVRCRYAADSNPECVYWSNWQNGTRMNPWKGGLRASLFIL